MDRIVSIGAFEHFGHDRYDTFFRFAHDALPADGGDARTRSGLEAAADHGDRQGMPLSFELPPGSSSSW